MCVYVMSPEWLHCPSCCSHGWRSANYSAAAWGQRQPHATKQGIAHLDLTDDKQTQKDISSFTLSHCVSCVLQNNELPADLTKSERILKVLRPKLLNGDSWWLLSSSCLPVLHWREIKQQHTVNSTQTQPVLYVVLASDCCHMLNKPGLNTQQHNVQPKCICPPHLSVSVKMVFHSKLFLFTPRCCKISRYFAH